MSARLSRVSRLLAASWLTLVTFTGLAAQDAVEAEAHPAEDFNSCPIEGNADGEDLRKVNVLKNRFTAPTRSDLDSSITLSAILQPGDDEHRWSESTGAIVTGYVFRAMRGGEEPANCGDSAAVYQDTHIEITLNGRDTLKTRRMIVEVTPRWRAFMASKGEDWSSQGLIDAFKGKCAEATGWMFWDAQHGGEAENTAPGAEDNWRASAWEIHPVTSLRVVPCT